MDQLRISFTDKPVEELFKPMEIQSVNWDALLPHLANFVRLRDYEVIEGLIVNDTEVRVIIGKKRPGPTGKKKKPIQKTINSFQKMASNIFYKVYNIIMRIIIEFLFYLCLPFAWIIYNIKDASDTMKYNIRNKKHK